MRRYRDEAFIEAIQEAKNAINKAIGIVAYDDVELHPWACGLLVTVKICSESNDKLMALRYRIDVVNLLEGVGFRRDCKTKEEALNLMQVRLSELTRNTGMSVACPLTFGKDLPKGEKELPYGFQCHFGEGIIEVTYTYCTPDTKVTENDCPVKMKSKE